MSNLPKPQPCGQNWLAMQPTANGRRCGQCEKEIYDFSAMSWPAIARTQAAHGNALCGMYAPEQLAHWGQTPPASACARLAAATSIALALAAIPAAAQVVPPTRLTLSGTVTMLSPKGKPKPLPFATVLLAGTSTGVSTDERGYYELPVPDDVATPTLVFSSIGFENVEWAVPAASQGVVQHDAQLAINPNSALSVFSVRKPTAVERTKWTLRRWLGRQPQ
ncbi:carboxypeptidase-like regulatory domain-containing protein [Hymenobacter lucidus]|uniref:Carboxypeptidase-like regulatory domain-containing protein n=1 Tax=Hymenobacter lucidus TaxID=2880930 RepID=A0ABS8AW28_9BACT|nr:carboxypeptidase-like regulatory domain-containing protein [Hymenobacter lucidus]MCB2409989.1 carboxypeptidase-like regulatory domain-containing protein [Hymenobacter lucidus]